MNDNLSTTDLDPNVASLLGGLSLGAVPAREQTPEQLRAILAESVADLDRGIEPEDLSRVVDAVIDGPVAAIHLRVYSNDREGEEPGVIVYFHGGGFAGGSIDTHDKTTRRLAAGTDYAVVSVEYRLSPENPFPAGFDDCYCATLWVSEHFAGKPLILAGDSAGGALACGVALKARDEAGPSVAALVMIYPPVDLDTTRPSMIEFGKDYILNVDDIDTYMNWYLPADADRTHAYALPGNATSFAGMPPTIIATAGFDPLISSEYELIERFREAGAHVVHLQNPTLTHGWTEYVNVVPAAMKARSELIDALSDLIRDEIASA